MLFRSLIATTVALTAVPVIAQASVADGSAGTSVHKAAKIASAKPCRAVKWHPTPPGKPNSYILRTRYVGDCSGTMALNDARPAGPNAVQATE